MIEKLNALIATVELTEEKVGLETLKELVKEAKKLEEDSTELEYLKACGVDNWSGYEEAMEMMQDTE